MSEKSMNISEYLEVLLGDCEKLRLKRSSFEIHKELKKFYNHIQNCPKQVPDYTSLKCSERKLFKSIMNSLILLFDSNVFSADLMLLNGTCLSLFVSTLFSPKYASCLLISFYDWICKNFPDIKDLSSAAEQLLGKLNNDVAPVNEFSISSKHLLGQENDILNMKSPVFQKIAILHGMISCQNAELFSFKLKDRDPFLVVIYQFIHDCCITPCSYQYHAFSVMLSWLKVCDQSFPNKESYFFIGSDIVEKTLLLLECNWQSPIKGVNGFIKEIYKVLIDISQKNCSNTGDKSLVQHMLERSLNLSYKAKGKYILLSAVLPHLDYSKFLKQNSELPEMLFLNLKANYMASAVAEVYKIIVLKMIALNSEENAAAKWSNLWLKPIVNCLCSGDKLLVQNMTNIILSWTLKNFPKCYDIMMNIDDYQDDAIKLLMLHVAKEIGICTLSKKEINLIRRNMHHNSIQIRTQILSILCSTPKKSEAVNPEELELLQCFIVENLNIDSAPFHHHLLSQLRILLVRIRDSLAKEYHFFSKNGISDANLSQFKFVDFLTYTAIKHTFPGACYQRRRLCLQILNTVFDVFVVSPKGNKRKEKPSKSVNLVIEWAKEHNLWLFFYDEVLLNIMPCILDFTDEIRGLASNLILLYSKWPLLQHYSLSDPVIQYALALCNHPDYRNNDGGAKLCSIIFQRFCGNFSPENCISSLEFLKDLVSLTRQQLTLAQKNILSAAANQPIHGLLLALQYCLSNSKELMVALANQNNSEVNAFINDAKQLCFDVIDFMIKIMKGNSEGDNCPSFSDIGKALEQLVISQNVRLSESKTCDQIDYETERSLNPESTIQCELILSLCWHCVKNSSYVLCELSSLILILDADISEKKHSLVSISDVFISTLISCRHRGVVEACCLALNKFCINFREDKTIYEYVTRKLLESVFKILHDTSNVSVTRRSAGLPLLFQAVISSEENSLNRKLLSYAMDNLLVLISEPLPCNEISDKLDLPQAHAYHILKALVLDASLSQAILPYFDVIIPVCIAGFLSDVWAIRNGALQLFGSLLPRLCGQKKVRDDDSEHNLISASELFARCPSLKTYLLRELNICVEFHHQKALSSKLIPVLSVIAKLMPENENSRNYIADFIPLLRQLLDIPVWKARDLVSTSLSLLLKPEDVCDILEETKSHLRSVSISFNKIHGLLLILQKLARKTDEKVLLTLTMDNVLEDLYHLVKHKTGNSLFIGMVMDIMLSVSKNNKRVFPLVPVEECFIPKGFQVGTYYHDTVAALMHLKRIDLLDLPEYLKKLICKNKDVQQICLQHLSSKLSSQIVSNKSCIEKHLRIWKEILESVFIFLEPNTHPSVTEEALKFLMELLQNETTENMIDAKIMLQLLEHLSQVRDMQIGLTVSALSFTVSSLCIKYLLQKSNERLNLEKWNLLFSEYCQPRTSDVLRMEAAKSLTIAGPILCRYLSNKIAEGCDESISMFTSIYSGSLLLLQDEDEEIRSEACKFASSIPHLYQAPVLQFNIGIKIVFQNMFETLSSQPSILSYFWNRLQNYPSSAQILLSFCKFKKTSLFEQEYTNVFAEPHQLILYYQYYFKLASRHWNQKDKNLHKKYIDMFLHDIQVELEDVLSVLSLSKEFINEGFSYHHQVYLALKKLKCQVDVLCIEDYTTYGNCSSKICNVKEKWNRVEEMLPSVTCWFLNQLYDFEING